MVVYHDMTKAKAWFETVAYKRNVFELKMRISNVFLLKASINMSILVWMFFPVWSAFFQTTSNYHARRFGVRAAMPGFIAKRLCPQLIIVPPNFDKYQAVSREVSLLSHSYLQPLVDFTSCRETGPNTIAQQSLSLAYPSKSPFYHFLSLCIEYWAAYMSRLHPSISQFLGFFFLLFYVFSHLHRKFLSPQKTLHYHNYNLN